MINYITPERISNRILMDLETSSKKLFFLVEGQNDSKLFKKFLCNELTIIPTFGKESLINVIKKLEKEKFEKYIGVIDQDFDKILNINHEYPNLFKTDNHDIEVMMINSEAFENIIYVHGKEDKILNFIKADNNKIKNTIYEIGKEIAKLKLANFKELGLVFKPKELNGKPINFNKFIQVKDFKYLGQEKLIETVMNYSRGRNTQMQSKQKITDEFNSIPSDYNILDLVNGHDLSKLLFLLLNSHLTSSSKKLSDVESLESSLILAYEFEMFKKTELFKQLDKYSQVENIKLFKN